MDFSKACHTAAALEKSVQSIIEGQAANIRQILACMACGGHVLLEDNPGTGKTTLAKAIAGSVRNADFKRLQFTPDLLPSDILGVSILNPKSGSFSFHPGPVFTDILLADEINRASPRTQSALLESMAERQATIEGVCHDLNGLFFVIATQNPVEFRGTYPLPEAQMDRFTIRSSLGYVGPAEEAAILSAQQTSHPLESLEATVSLDDFLQLQNQIKQIRISEELNHYIVALCSATRHHSEILLPASPRASLALMKMAKSMALFEGMEFVTPQLIQDLAISVIAHRLVLTADAKFSGRTAENIITEIIEKTAVPS
ncbi:AAA family ATPase [Persicirhabdus sediminis]|uniref:MoxR family ATPase n=1 Tax=Persicirhabdus sediminis TaxID=454144 RepID=A0A8J7SHR8_9BACT|nr:MoxR family ATPase [Persicirhabdus sediminis]MBK1790965.1 MoxR family ATPase [Persicirhabdus sediminis]